MTAPAPAGAPLAWPKTARVTLKHPSGYYRTTQAWRNGELIKFPPRDAPGGTFATLQARGLAPGTASAGSSWAESHFSGLDPCSPQANWALCFGTRCLQRDSRSPACRLGTSFRIRGSLPVAISSPSSTCVLTTAPHLAPFCFQAAVAAAFSVDDPSAVTLFFPNGIQMEGGDAAVEVRRWGDLGPLFRQALFYYI